eukprot:TRINITY_DN6734_c0_g1_i1.p2 TRINITY_DN6734_c0_g1~~TRINITY_DN6734_c0_g1_i1.p2  ORF type:complete len:240 (-),score=64.54 TRINITY_DN6734_c0_g1_i1:58-777(-)
MVSRSGPRSGHLGAFGHFALALAFVAVVLLGAGWLSLSSCQEKQARLIDRLRTEEEDFDPAALANQRALLRNLTVRLRTAEAALERLRRDGRKASKSPARRSAPAARAAPAPPPAPEENVYRSDGKSEDDEEDDDSKGEKAGGSSPDADEEEQDKQREREYEDQLTLIKYDKSANTFLRYRPDFKCGTRAPILPDDTVVECNAAGPSPCCSSLGWCGSTKAHCNCPVCVDYRKQSAGQG